MTLFLDSAPYQNLTLTGPMGAGKTAVGRMVAERLQTRFFDIENEILLREGQSVGDIRELFGESRIKTLQAELIRDLTLHRHAVLAISGPALLDQDNRTRLTESGPVLCLTCALNEILRRLYVARGAWFQNPANRGVLLSRLKREQRVAELDLPQLDTTRLSIEETTDAVITFWLDHAQL